MQFERMHLSKMSDKNTQKVVTLKHFPLKIFSEAVFYFNFSPFQLSVSAGEGETVGVCGLRLTITA